jgi:hypothetical protein
MQNKEPFIAAVRHPQRSVSLNAGRVHPTGKKKSLRLRRATWPYSGRAEEHIGADLTPLKNTGTGIIA